eukprot:jgi/Psemu1/11792/gm1.11792_g
MSPSKPIQALVFRVAQLHWTLFEFQEGKGKVVKKEVFHSSLESSLGTGRDSEGMDNGRKTLRCAIHKKRDLKRKHTFKATENSSLLLFPRSSGSYFLAAKAQRAQEVVKRIDPGYGWKIQAAREPIADPSPQQPAPPKMEESDLIQTHFPCGHTSPAR